MARLTVLMGAPGAGKSTRARTMPGEVVSTDDARANPDLRSDPARRGEVMSRTYKRLHELLTAGEDAILDTTSASPQVRKAALGIARRHGAQADVHVFDTSVELCVEAQKTREHPVPEAVVRRYHANIRRQIPRLEYEGFDTVEITRRRR